MSKYGRDRRKFIRDLGVGTASLLATPAMARSFSGSGDSGAGDAFHKEPVQLGKDVRIELLTRDNYFLGIGSVIVNDQSLRDPKIPLFCDIRTPDGIRVEQFPIIQKIISPEKIEIRMGAITRKTPVMEYMLHTVRNRENVYGWIEQPIEQPRTFLTLTILPVVRTFGKQTYTGFSYQYQFESGDLPVYKILDHGSWEINEQALGNECWMRIGHVPSVVSLSAPGQSYSTENYYRNISNPNVFQFLPLQTELQGFTFQAHEKGVLITWATEIAHIRTLIEKPAEASQLFHFHQHCGDLSYDFKTSPIEVLWIAKSPTDRVERYNLYESVRREIHRHLHEKAGIIQERVSAYGMIEEWTEPDFDHYTEVILPQMMEKGIRRIFLPNQFRNNMNTWGLSNMCCNVDFQFSETAGPEKIRRFCSRAMSNNIIIDMWGNTAISTLTEIFQRKDGREKGIHFLPEKGSITEVLKKAKDPFVRNPSNAIEADHYTPVFAVLNLRDPDIRSYWMQQWKIAYEAGIHGIFLDSSFNMSSDKFHFIQNTNRDQAKGFYRPDGKSATAILSQYHAHLQWVKEMQEMGYSYCGEDLGVFGVHRHGPDLKMFIDCMPLFTESFMDFSEDQAKQAGMEPLHVFFKGLACRIMWMMKWDFSCQCLSLGIENPKAFDFIKAFNVVNDYMQEREVLPGEAGVRYDSGRDEKKTSVFWILEKTDIELEEVHLVWEVIGNRKFRTRTIHANPLSVYLVTK